MNKKMEMERGDLVVDNDIQLDDDGKSIFVYLETWLDAEKKFNEDLSADDTWLNLYATYDPFADTLKMAYTVNMDNGSIANDYFPTENEEKLVKDLITEKIHTMYGQTPQEFCQTQSQLGEAVYVYHNTAGTVKKSTERQNHVKDFCHENGYEIGGSYSISLPMSKCGAEFPQILDYCRSRGISKIVVGGKRDLGSTSDEANQVIEILCAQGFSVETADQGQRYTACLENTEPDEDDGLTIGGQT